LHGPVHEQAEVVKSIVLACDLCKREAPRLTRVRIQVGEHVASGEVCIECGQRAYGIGDQINGGMAIAPKRGRPAKALADIDLGVAIATRKIAPGTADLTDVLQCCTYCGAGPGEPCEEDICHEHAGGGLKEECPRCLGIPKP
jgi:hypothetical protein